MGNIYSQLSLEERIEIYRFFKNGMSLRGIAPHPPFEVLPPQVGEGEFYFCGSTL